ncbi:MAG: LapA family protein [Desulfomonilia bacterium]|nr:LapA family protein [Desulfomonilia bacterium]
MHAFKTAVFLGLLFALITLCIHNTDVYLVSFMTYRFPFPVQLWVLLLVFFFAGMLPVVFYRIPGNAAHRKRMRFLRNKIAQMENDLRSPD